MRTEFQNPVYPETLADPFCFFHEGTYYAVGTGHAKPADAPRVVPMVKSQDLQNWTSVGDVLVPPDEERGGEFWAPEVAFRDGLFYLYYHPGRPGGAFRIRVAVSPNPEGPYIDTGTPLTDAAQNDFAIDSHAFRDDDGQWYLFYATDFTDSDAKTFRGTALVVDRLETMTRLAGTPQVVMRAHWPWQCFEAMRDWRGVKADWYTLEGPTVVKRSGKYYCFYSGGCWENDTYGVDYLVADHVLGPWQEVGGERGPQVMRTVPGRVIGPGHHSIVSSPDGTQDFAVYHAWNDSRTERLMWVDPLLWTPDGPVIERFRDHIRSVSVPAR